MTILRRPGHSGRACAPSRPRLSLHFGSLAPWSRRLRPAALLCLVLLWSNACARGAGVAHGEASLDALARAVLDAVEQRDADRLRQLALSEQEFRGVVWPELPAARPERNLPFSFVWGDLRLKSEAALAETLNNYGGLQFELLRAGIGGGTTQYKTYVVHREAVLVVRGEEGSREEVELRFFGSVFERDGVFKVFSYVVD